MFPSKSNMDYMSEINRLFPKSESIEPRNMAQNYSSPFQTANKSSSSADSFSPDFYFDHQLYRQNDNLSRNRCDTPKHKYFGSTTNINEMKSNFGSTQNMLTLSPPNSIYGSPDMNASPRNIFERQSVYETKMQGSPTFDSLLDMPNYTSATTFRVRRPIVGRNIWGNSQETQKNETDLDFLPLPPKTPERNQKNYELFPERRELPSQTVKPTDPYTFIQNSYNPMQTQYNPDSGMYKMCTFCKKNGETPVVYMTHNVKEKVSNRQVVTCPILRALHCSTCGATGDDAHTITYCPVLKRSNNGKPLQSTTITLKNTRIKSNGKRRY